MKYPRFTFTKKSRTPKKYHLPSPRHPICHCENLPTSLGYQKFQICKSGVFNSLPPLFISIINFLRNVIPIFVELLVRPTEKRGVPFLNLSVFFYSKKKNLLAKQLLLGSKGSKK